MTAVFAGVGEGQTLYDSFCQVCHGGLGEGQTMGKPLNDNSAKRLEDLELLEVISNGRAGTGMAAWAGSLTEQEIFDIASYVRVLQGGSGLSLDEGANQASDDPMAIAGEALFNGEANCVSCHSYRDQGGDVGPKLDGVSSRLNAAALREALLNPSRSIVSGFEVKEVVQPNGDRIRGRFRNDSELAVQIQSADGSRWVTYFKDRVESISDSTESLMPEVFASLSDSQQEEIIAFLNSL